MRPETMHPWLTGSPLAALAIALFIFSSCGGEGQEAPEAKLKRSVAFARNVLRAVERNGLASGSYQSSKEMGGNVLGFVTAHVGETDDYAPFVAGPPSRPWTVVLGPGDGPDSYVIEGYGEDLAKPLIVERVDLKPLPLR